MSQTNIRMAISYEQRGVEKFHRLCFKKKIKLAIRKCLPQISKETR
jgi:predicted RNA binding protein with dsRBD fold (UPF0201 family)